MCMAAVPQRALVHAHCIGSGRGIHGKIGGGPSWRRFMATGAAHFAAGDGTGAGTTAGDVGAAAAVGAAIRYITIPTNISMPAPRRRMTMRRGAWGSMWWWPRYMRAEAIRMVRNPRV